MARKRPGLVATRRVVAGVLVFVGMFVIFFGLGNGNQIIMLTGAGLTLLALGSRVVNALRGSMRQWVTGIGQVVWVSEPPSATPFGRCELHLRIEAPDVPAETVAVREPRQPIDRWPYVGQRVPIEVAADDVRNVRIVWPDGDSTTWHGNEPEPLWADDQPAPVPAQPPGSHLDLDNELGAELATELDDELDFDLDGPPSRSPIAPAETSPADEGRIGPHVTIAEDTGARVPRPRPQPTPRPSPRPRTEAAPDQASETWTTYPGANPAPSGSVHRVGVTLLVRELDRSVAFYRDTLGFHEVDSGPDIAVLASGETRLVLHAYAGMGRVNRRVAHLNLDVADIELLYADLKDAGVRFTYAPRRISSGHRLEQWAAAFRDPDGHGVALTEWRTRAAADR